MGTRGVNNEYSVTVRLIKTVKYAMAAKTSDICSPDKNPFDTIKYIGINELLRNLLYICISLSCIVIYICIFGVLDKG